MVKTLTKSVREYKKQSILTPIFMVLEVIFECLIPLFMSRLIDEIEGAGNNLTMRPILINGGILVGLAALLFLILAGAMLALTAMRFGQKEDAGRILRKICGRTCFIRCRAFRSGTWINFRPRLW